MNVGISVHNLVVVGALAALFSLLIKLAGSTGLANIPILGDGIRLLGG